MHSGTMHLHSRFTDDELEVLVPDLAYGVAGIGVGVTLAGTKLQMNLGTQWLLTIQP